MELARRYDELLVIAVDTPFVVLGEALAVPEAAGDPVQCPWPTRHTC